MTGSTTRPNYFLLLGLDPDSPWEAVKFEAALKARISEWSRQSAGIGAKAIAAQKNREMVPDIRRVMDDQALRQAEAAAAKKAQATAAQDRVAVFEGQLTMAEAKGYLEKGEFDRFVTDFKDILSEQEIRRRLKVEVRQPASLAPKPVQKLDPSVIKSIEQRLLILGVSDLYQLFGMEQNRSSAVALCAAADQLYHDMTLRQPKDAEVTARSELAGYAKDIFQSADKRKAYDESLRLQSLAALLKQLDESMSRLSDKMLYAGQVQLFLQQAGEAGWQKNQALARLREHALLRKWPIEVPTLDMSEQLRCGSCGAINPRKSQFCSKCTRPLYLTCPNCDASVPSEESGCPVCGFPVGEAFIVDRTLVECEDLLKHGDSKTADQRLRTIERTWAPKKADARVEKIRSCREKIQAVTADQHRHIEQLRLLIQQRRFYAAQRYQASISAQLADEVKPYQQSILETMTRVRELIRQAQAPSAPAERRAEYCLQALHICADAEEARALLSTIPPGAPGHLQVKVNGTVVSLNWSASPSRGVSYKVVRKSYARPSSVTDGTLLTTTTGCMYDDAQAENGLPLFYAVFSAYEEVTSTQAAVLARPVVLTGDVSQVTAFVDSQFVDLRWRLPEHVYDVIVVRASGHPPASPQNGTHLTLADKGHLIDRAVQNEQRYYYGIYCQYRDYDQHLLTSPGVFTEVMPEAPPEAITRVEIQGERRPEGDLVRLSWQPPAKGQSMILKTIRRPRLKLYDRIGRAELAEHGELLQGREGMVTDTLSGSSIVYYVPVVVFQNSAYIGEPQRYVCIEDIKQLEVENLGGTLRLQWAWPEHCQEALVCFDYQTWPVPERATINVTRVSRAEYEYRGHYDISGTANHDCYIVVAAVIKQNNEEIIAAGVRHRARLASKIVLSYEIKQARSLFGPRQYTLHLYTRTPGQLPDLLLINKQGRLPILKTEGEVFFRLPGPVQIADHLAIPLPDTSRPPRTFARLYLEDDRYYDEVIIHHPNEDKLRLS